MNIQVQPHVKATHCNLPLFIAALLLVSAPEVVAAATDPPKLDVGSSSPLRRVALAVRSSAMHVSLLRPTTSASRAAPSQL
jgi:hypothetical protein